jgi:hypothetical protein
VGNAKAIFGCDFDKFGRLMRANNFARKSIFDPSREHAHVVAMSMSQE